MEEVERKAFAFYRSFMDAIETIPDEIKKAKAYKVIVEYGLNGVEPTNNEDLVIKVIFKQAKPQIDANLKRYANCVKNGKKGGAPKKSKKPKNNQEITKEEPKTNQETTKEQPENNQETTLKDKDKEKDKVKDKDKERDKSLYENLSLKYPKLLLDFENLKNVDLITYNIEQLEKAIEESEYLQSANLSFILNNYEKVITGYYRTIKPEKSEQSKSRNYDNREYSEEDYNNLFTDLDKIQI